MPDGLVAKGIFIAEGLYLPVGEVGSGEVFTYGHIVLNQHGSAGEYVRVLYSLIGFPLLRNGESLPGVFDFHLFAVGAD
jgi:hypothetical protein